MCQEIIIQMTTTSGWQSRALTNFRNSPKNIIIFALSGCRTIPPHITELILTFQNSSFCSSINMFHVIQLKILFIGAKHYYHKWCQRAIERLTDLLHNRCCKSDKCFDLQTLSLFFRRPLFFSQFRFGTKLKKIFKNFSKILIKSKKFAKKTKSSENSENLQNRENLN